MKNKITLDMCQNLICQNPKQGDDTEACRADAALIVRAVNEYDALKAVAEQAKHAASDIECLMRMLVKHADISCDGGNLAFSLGKIKEALANLAKIQGK